ncbi:unnamed protein product [Coffea canephora]|uniref:Uncharacterized protein n=1 Tax=Coffea canephora TaxID=49390 RepID=A0A068U4Z9_COFCA|nr:unnamed protein product [Coffea canephora]
MRGRLCQPSVRHPSLSSIQYPSAENNVNSILACLNALDPKYSGLKPAPFSRAFHLANGSCLSTRAESSQHTMLHISFCMYISAKTLSARFEQASSESNIVE